MRTDPVRIHSYVGGMSHPLLLEELARIRQAELRRMGGVPRVQGGRASWPGRIRVLAPRGRRVLGAVIPQLAWHR